MFVYGIGLSSIHAVEFKDCIQYQGYWTEWALVRLDIRGGYNGMTFRPMNSDPWLYYLGFTIDNFAFPTKQEIKAHKKENREYFYTGTCEYYVCDEYPTITSILKKETGGQGEGKKYETCRGLNQLLLAMKAGGGEGP